MKLVRLLIIMMVCILGATWTHGADDDKKVAVFLFCGQSNMESRGGSPAKAGHAEPCENFFEFVKVKKDRVFKKAGLGKRSGPETALAHALDARFAGKKAYVVKSAVGGTSLFEKWKPVTGGCYKNFVKDVDRAFAMLKKEGLEPYVAGMFWMQGEADAKDYTREHGKVYDKNLNAYIAHMREKYGKDMPFIFGRIHDKLITSKPYKGKSFSGANDVRDGMAKVAEADPLTTMVDTDSFALANDKIHFSNKGVWQLGAAFAKEWEKLQK